MKPNATLRSLGLCLLSCMIFSGSWAQKSQRISGDTRNQFFRSIDFTAYQAGVTTVGGGQAYENGTFNWDASIVLHDNCGMAVNGGEYGVPGSYQLFRKVRELRSTNPILGPSQTGYVGVGFSDENGNRDGLLVFTDPGLTPVASPAIVGGYYLYDAAGQADEFLCVTELSGGGVVAAGYTSPYPGSTDKDILVVRINPDLSVGWEVHIGNPGGNDEAWGIVELPNGNVMIAGATNSLSNNGFRSPFLGEIEVGTGNIAGGNNNFYVYQFIPLIGFPIVDSYFLDIENGPNNSVITTGVHSSGNPNRVLVGSFNLGISPPPFTMTGFGSANLNAVGTGVVFNNQTDQYTLTGYDNGNNFPLGSYDGFALNLDLSLNYNIGVNFGQTGPDFSFDVDVDPNGLLAFGARNGSFSGGGVSPISNYLLISDDRGLTDCDEFDWQPEQFYPRYTTQTGASSTGFAGTQILSGLPFQTSPVAEFIICTTTCKQGYNHQEEEEAQAGVVVDSEASVSPNPASDRIIISFTEGSEVRILDLNGRVLRSQRISDSGPQRLTVNVQDLAKGVYFAEVQLPHGQVKRIKWVKK